MKRVRRNRHTRRGATTVEVAVMAPVMLLMMLGFMEVANAFMLKHTVTLAADQGGRAASLPGATLADVNAAVDEAMGAAGLEGYATRSNLDLTDPENPELWVEVSISLDRGLFTGNLLGGGNIEISTRRTSRREDANRPA
ncbi:MAG: pilus assembly protein [Phycisphaerales bacterium]|nr:pilus assembly protein [Phycisphaerales bacterium]